jgi:hypothetical protein
MISHRENMIEKQRKITNKNNNKSLKVYERIENYIVIKYKHRKCIIVYIFEWLIIFFNFILINM